MLIFLFYLSCLYLYLLILLLNCCTNIGILNKKKVELKKNVEDYKIEVYVERDKYNDFCIAKASITNQKSTKEQIYIEVRALDKKNTIISVANFVVKNLKSGQKTLKSSDFSKIKSCGKIFRLEIYGG